MLVEHVYFRRQLASHLVSPAVCDYRATLPAAIPQNASIHLSITPNPLMATYIQPSLPQVKSDSLTLLIVFFFEATSQRYIIKCRRLDVCSFSVGRENFFVWFSYRKVASHCVTLWLAHFDKLLHFSVVDFISIFLFFLFFILTMIN